MDDHVAHVVLVRVCWEVTHSPPVIASRRDRNPIRRREDNTTEITEAHEFVAGQAIIIEIARAIVVAMIVVVVVVRTARRWCRIANAYFTAQLLQLLAEALLDERKHREQTKSSSQPEMPVSHRSLRTTAFGVMRPARNFAGLLFGASS
jgi:hypothetical protein